MLNALNIVEITAKFRKRFKSYADTDRSGRRGISGRRGARARVPVSAPPRHRKCCCRLRAVWGRAPALCSQFFCPAAPWSPKHPFVVGMCLQAVRVQHPDSAETLRVQGVSTQLRRLSVRASSVSVTAAASA